MITIFLAVCGIIIQILRKYKYNKIMNKFETSQQVYKHNSLNNILKHSQSNLHRITNECRFTRTLTGKYKPTL